MMFVGLFGWFSPLILVQQSTTVSFPALPVLRTLFMPMPVHEKLIVKIVNFVFFKVVAFFFLHFLNF